MVRSLLIIVLLNIAGMYSLPTHASRPDIIFKTDQHTYDIPGDIFGMGTPDDDRKTYGDLIVFINWRTLEARAFGPTGGTRWLFFEDGANRADDLGIGLSRSNDHVGYSPDDKIVVSMFPEIDPRRTYGLYRRYSTAGNRLRDEIFFGQAPEGWMKITCEKRWQVNMCTSMPLWTGEFTYHLEFDRRSLEHWAQLREVALNWVEAHRVR